MAGVDSASGRMHVGTFQTQRTSASPPSYDLLTFDGIKVKTLTGQPMKSTTMESSPSSTPFTSRSDLVLRLLHGAWLGVLLGLSVEAILLTVQVLQEHLPEPALLVADTVQKVSWSSLICAAIAAGQAVARNRIAIVGLIGATSAPIAFLLARSIHKAILEVSSNEIITTVTPWLGAGIKGLEYALLGAALTWLSRNDRDWKLYAMSGIAIGSLSYAILLGFTPAAGNPVQQAIVEILHPVGCALAVYMASKFKRLIKESDEE